MADFANEFIEMIEHNYEKFIEISILFLGKSPKKYLQEFVKQSMKYFLKEQISERYPIVVNKGILRKMLDGIPRENLKMLL